MRQNTTTVCREQKHPLRFQKKPVSPTLTAAQVTLLRDVADPDEPRFELLACDDVAQRSPLQALRM